MKRGKKVLALLLAVSMTLSLLTVGAAAADVEQDTMSTVEQQDSGSKNVPDAPEAGPAGDPAGEPADDPEGNPVERAADVAAIGDQKYATLQAAIDAAQSNDTILLLKSIGSEEIGAGGQMVFDGDQSNKTITLDLQGNTVTASAGEAVKLNGKNITLTIQDGKIENFAEGQYSDGLYAYAECSDLSLTLKDVTLHSRTQTLAVNGTTSNSCVTLKDSVLISNEELGIYYPPKTGTLTIENTQITGETGIVIKGSTVDISGDRTEITGVGQKVNPEEYYNGSPSGTLTMTGDAIYVESGYNDRDIELKITDGTFNSKNSLAVQMFIKAGESTEVSRDIAISGGTFSSKVDKTYLADGVVQNANGEVGKLEQVAVAEATTKDGAKKYETLQKAVDAAVDGGTVKLLDNIVLDACVTVTGKAITLDMNQKTTTNTKDIWGGNGGAWSHIRVGENGDLTITGDGTIQAKENDCYAIDLNGTNAKCTIENGTFIGNISAVYVYTGALTVKGGSFSIQQKETGADGERFTLNCRDENYESKTASITVSGGTFKNFDPADCLAEGKDTNFCAKGYASVKDGDWYTVMPLTQAAVAQVGDAYYTTLQAAFEKAEDKATVRLLKNAEITGQITVRKDLTLDLGENTLVNAGTGYAFVVSTGKSFTLTNGTLKSNTGNGVAGVGKTTVTVAHDATIDTNGPAVFGTNNKSEEGHAAFRVYGTLISNDIGVFIQGPCNTIDIDGATIHSDYFGVYQNGSFGGGKFTIKNSTIIDKSGPGIYISNSKGNTTDAAQGYQTLTIENSSISGSSAVEVKYTNVTISGNNTELIATGTPINTVPNNNGQVSVGYALAVTHNGKFKKDGSVESADAAAGTVAIKSGNFQGLIGVQDPIGEGQTTTADVEISGGYFTSDPSDYVAADHYVVDSDKAGYSCMVTDEKPEEVPVIVTETVEATVSENAEMNDADKAAVTTLLKSNPPAVSGIADALTESGENAILNAAGVTAEDKQDANKLIKIEIEAKVEAVHANLTNGELTFKVTPVATVTIDGVAKEKEVPVDNGYLDGKGITVKLPVPEKFDVQEIKHTSDSKGVEYFLKTGTNTFTVKDGYAELTIRHFSELKLSGSVTAAAMVDGTAYPTLQDAIDAASNGDTITVLAGVNKTERVTVSGKSLTIELGETAYSADNIATGSRTEKVVNGTTVKITYSAPSGGGSSSSGDYIVDVEDSKHGTVTVSPKRADKGDTVTITVRPDKGYELDELTVTDKNGDAVKLKDKGNSKFTFTMPGSKVTVEASFKRIETEPEAPAFVDVPAGAYYADAVAWAVEQGVTTGTSANTFSPDLSCTRAQMVTFLWRANGSPKAAKANPFTDVSADAYYYDAVLWAAEKGITSGTTATTFSPDAVLTRSQTVTFLWRANGSPVVNYAMNFADVDGSAYYTEAVRWAVSEGITAGTGGNTFSPDAPCTRAQIVTFLYRDAK